MKKKSAKGSVKSAAKAKREANDKKAVKARKKATARKTAKAAGRAEADRFAGTEPDFGPLMADGLVLRVGGTTDENPEALAKRIVEDELPSKSGSWTVRRMGKESRDFLIARRTASGRTGVAKPMTAAAAFDLAYRLRRNRDVEDAEPSLVAPTEGAGEFRVRAAATVAAANAASSGSSGADLPCSADHEWIHTVSSIRAAWGLPLPVGGRSQGEGIIVGHPDTGYTLHPEINDPRLLASDGFDFLDDDTDAIDRLSGRSAGHGTSTGSVIMSGPGASSGVLGVAPKCRLVPLRVTDWVVQISFGNLASAIRHAADNGHHVVSISLGGVFQGRHLHRAVQYAVERGVIIVCAAGNHTPFVVWPAQYDEVIAAAACNCQRQVWSGSASGSAVDVTAPGESVWRALAEPSGFTVARSSGTSYATAVVAGTAALWLAHHGRDNLIARYGRANLAGVFKELLLRHGFDPQPGWNTADFGAGILNAKKLLEAPLPSAAPAGGLAALHATTAPRVTTQVDALTEMFSDADAPLVRPGLAALLKTTERNLNAAVRDVGDELICLAATSEPFRRQILAAGGARKTSARRKVATAAATTKTAVVGDVAMPTMSKSLQSMMR